MNKHMILAGALLLAGLSAHAQEKLVQNRGRDNWFVEVGGGFNWMVNISHEGIGLQNYGGLTPAASFQAGKWFTPEVGARIGWQGISWDHRNTEPFGFSYIHNDLLWNMTHSLWGYDPSRRWELVPYGHFGLLIESRDGNVIEREYAAGAGVLGAYALTDRLDVTLDLRALLLNGNASQGLGVAAANAAMLGLRYRLGATGWEPLRRRSGGRTLLNGWNDNWFVTMAGGVNFLSPLDFDDLHFYGKAAPAAEISFGKWVTPQVGLRLGVQGFRYQSEQDSFGFVYPHIDLLWNLSTTLQGGRDACLWNLIPYAHYGAIAEYEDPSYELFEREYAAGIGLLNRFSLAERLSLDVDLRSQFLTADASGRNAQIHALGLSAMAGLTYSLGNPSWDTWKRNRPAGDPFRRERQGVNLGGLWDNWFLQVSEGANFVWAVDRSGLHDFGWIRNGGEIALGKWFAPEVGARLGYQGMTLDERGFAYVHADFLWNGTNTLSGFRPDRVWNLIPYLHFGVVYEYDPDTRLERINTEYAGGAGLLNTFRLHDNVSLIADFRAHLLTVDASRLKNTHDLAASALFGVAYHFGEGLFKPSSGGVLSGRLLDNWFVSTGGGVNVLNRVAPAAEVLVGKWLSPEFGFRAGYQGLRYARDGKAPIGGVYTDADGHEHWGFSYVHGDFLWNLLNTVTTARRGVYSLVPYAHMGYLVEYRVKQAAGGIFEREYAAGAGLLNTFALNESVDAYLDLRATVLRGVAAGDRRAGTTVAGAVLAGLSCHLGRSGFDRAPSEDRDTPVEKHHWAVSTNLLDYADLGTFNATVQYAPARHWSVEGGVKFNPFDFNGKYDRKQTFAVGARWWPWYVYSGLWVKGLAQVQGYQREGIPVFSSGKGEAYGAGLSAGYALMLFKHFNLDFGVGVWGGRRNGNDAAKSWFVEPNDFTLGLQFVF